MSVDSHILAIDGDWRKGSNTMGIGWVLQTTDGRTIQGGGDYGLATSAIYAEAMASLKALHWAHARNITTI